MSFFDEVDVDERVSVPDEDVDDEDFFFLDFRNRILKICVLRLRFFF